jgi:Recombinase
MDGNVATTASANVPLRRLGRLVLTRKLGGPKLAEAREAAIASLKVLADRNASNVLPIIREIQRTGAASLHQIADALNARGISTPRGGKWYAKSVIRRWPDPDNTLHRTT